MDITLEELASITNLAIGTLRVYLSRSEFAEFQTTRKTRNKTKISFLLDETFIEKLINFLIIKEKTKNAELLKKYWSNFFNKNIINKDKELEDLKIKLEITSGHYENLLSRYKDVISINKQLQNSYNEILEICNEPTKNNEVLDLQNKIKIKLQ